MVNAEIKIIQEEIKKVKEEMERRSQEKFWEAIVEDGKKRA